MKCLNPCQNKSELSLLQGAAYLLGGWHELGLSNIRSKKKTTHYYYYYSNYNYYQMLRGIPNGPVAKTPELPMQEAWVPIPGGRPDPTCHN